ncbi:hypothetical protein C9374_009378 [Naegleria lovaniensis]|uniref:Mitochondrial fission 1 protein n=1 Tax=Naegleria lovaniensis TaxID=51637 RepID=A0AA88GDK0_NAELO|nr:uncharacterized protein C9374_009378 [Naegleria lovaniensis]KAG2377467.1 hypothetical protein C9374_009378 [Naegleria lovaniensis]
MFVSSSLPEEPNTNSVVSSSSSDPIQSTTQASSTQASVSTPSTTSPQPGRKLGKDDDEEYLLFLEKSLEEEQKYITPEDIEKAEAIYNSITDENAKNRSAFTLSVLYIKSGDEILIHKGISLLESILRCDHNIFEVNDLSMESSSHYKRDCLYLIALAFYFLKDYVKAEAAVQTLLEFDRENEQGKRLYQLIERKKKSLQHDGIIGLALAGVTTLAVGGLIGLGALAVGLMKSRR